MNAAKTLLLSLVLVFLLVESDAWRRRFRVRHIFRKVKPKPQCVAVNICGAWCTKNKCMWYCDNTCNVMVNNKYNWRGELFRLPCKFSAYDYTGGGYFYPSDLAYQIGKRGRELDNMMVFRRLDQNGDGRVSGREFSNTKKYLLIDQNTC